MLLVSSSLLITDTFPFLIAASGLEHIINTIELIMLKKLLLTAALSCVFMLGLRAQISVKGVVTDQVSGDPIQGVAILVKGTTLGVFTDEGGKYALDLPESANTLIMNFVGYKTVELNVDGRTTIDVALEVEDIVLDEVIITGFGQQVKRDVTGNIAKIDGEDLQGVPVTSVESALQGRAAGVLVSKQNGKLGQGISLRIRGSASVTASNEPLYVIDGIVVTTENQASLNASTNPLADINFNDIESIDILKDASAAAIYGSRGSNGVVIITTKKGKAGKTRFNVDYRRGFSEPTNTRDWLNGPEYLQLWDEAFDNVADPDGTLFGLTGEDWKDRRIPGWRDNNDTDWQSFAFQEDAGFEQIDLSASGGNAKTKFYSSVSYLDQTGIMIYNNFDRLSGRLNLDHQATDRVNIGMNLSLSRSQNDRLPDDNSFSTPLQLVALPPVQPLNDPDNPEELFGSTVYFNGKLYEDNTSFQTSVFRTLGNLYASWEIVKGLTLRSEFGVDFLSQNEDQYFNSKVARNTGEPNGFGEKAFTHALNFTLNNFATYSTIIGTDHSINAVLGASFQEYTQEFGSVEGRNFPNDTFRKLASAAEISGGTSTGTIYNIVSYFARANYKFASKYLVSLSARIDGDSRFGADERYGFFPAASVGWILSEESFMENVSLFNFLKLRGSYGVTGNTPNTNFPSRGLWNGAAGYAAISGISPTQSPNPNLKWETTTQMDIGIDFGIFNGRVSGEIDYYVKNTTDLLLDVNVPSSTGFLSQLRNVGELENKGFEFVVNTNNLVGDFKWNTSINIARNQNTITNLDGQVIEDGFVNRAVEGQPIGVFFAPEYAGVDPENGDALFYKNTDTGTGVLSRETTNNINEAERVVIGDPNPDFIYGMTNTFSWKGIDLTIFLQGVAGNQVYNGAGVFQMDGFGWFDNQDRRILDRWQQPGDVTDVPQVRFLSGASESSRFVEDADYLRLKTVTLGYTLPKSVTNAIKFDQIRIYATGQNVLTFTDYQGWDPEVNTDFLANNISLGNDFYAAPQARTIIFGINLGF